MPEILESTPVQAVTVAVPVPRTRVSETLFGLALAVHVSIPYFGLSDALKELP